MKFLKRALFLMTPSLKSSWFPYRGPKISTISVLFRLQYFDFIIRRSKTADLVWNLVYIILARCPRPESGDPGIVLRDLLDQLGHS